MDISPEDRKAAEALLGRPLPNDEEQLIEAISEIWPKDPALAKRLAGASADPDPKSQRAAKKVEASQRRSERLAALRQRLRQMRDGLLYRQISLQGKRNRVFNKPVLLLGGLLLVAGMVYAIFGLQAAPQAAATGPAAASAVRLSPQQAREASADELFDYAEERLGRPLAGSREGLLNDLSDLDRLDPELAAELRRRLEFADTAQGLADLNREALDDITQAVESAGFPEIPVGPPAVESQQPPPPVAPPPPTAPPPPPPPPGAAQFSGVVEQEFFRSGPAIIDAPREQRGMVIAEVERGRGMMVERPANGTPLLLAEASANRAFAVLAERAAPQPSIASAERRAGANFVTLAEQQLPAAPESPRLPSPAPSPDNGNEAPLFDPFVPSGSTLLPGTLAAQGQPFADDDEFPFGSQSPAPAQAPRRRPLPESYQVGRPLRGRLNIQLTVIEGQPAPAIIETADGAIWVGEATLGPLNRVEINLSSLYFAGENYPVRASAYQRGVLGLDARVQEQAPTLAQDALRAAANSFSRYVDLLSRQSTVIQRPDGGVTQTQQAPGLEFVLLGELGQLFRVPETRRSLVRVATVNAGTVLDVIPFDLPR